jgi:uncharacterized protein YqhQ
VPPPDHFYGGQAVLEGVMMRGRRHWAIAVRRPDASIHTEAHPIRSVAERWPVLAKPGLRGVLALGQALSIGMRALSISAAQASPDEERPSSGQMAVSMTVAIVVFVGIFVVGPYLAFRAFRHAVPNSLTRNLLEGLLRVGLFLAYLALIGRVADVRRVFQYHGAEHKTIAAFEHGDPLQPEAVDRYSTLHVRCGTNFLLLVMLLTILIYAGFSGLGLLGGILLRIVTIPVIAGLSFELLRLGARYPGSRVIRVLMAPGLWLQKITTRPPDRGQIQVAIASFEALRAAERATVA